MKRSASRKPIPESRTTFHQPPEIAEIRKLAHTAMDKSLRFLASGRSSNKKLLCREERYAVARIIAGLSQVAENIDSFPHRASITLHY
jgi:hypothetical protein